MIHDARSGPLTVRQPRCVSKMEAHYTETMTYLVQSKREKQLTKCISLQTLKKNTHCISGSKQAINIFGLIQNSFFKTRCQILNTRNPYGPNEVLPVVFEIYALVLIFCIAKLSCLCFSTFKFPF